MNWCNVQRCRGGSSAGQSSGLIIRRSWVRVPPAPPGVLWVIRWASWNDSWNESPYRRTITAVPRVARGHVEQLPSGSFRAVVYVGVDPLTRRPIYLKATARTEKQAQVELGKLLGKACDGRRPESDATVARLLEEYVQIAGWELSTRESNLGYIRRTIRPALGSMQVRKVRGPLLDRFYARLMRCGNLACTGKPFTRASQRARPQARPGRPPARVAAGRGSCAGSDPLRAAGPR